MIKNIVNNLAMLLKIKDFNFLTSYVIHQAENHSEYNSRNYKHEIREIQYVLNR